MREVETVRDLRRGQIIRAARRVVAERGVGALTFATLEQELAFTRGVITYHFANKDEIVEAVLDDAIAEIDDATSSSVSAEATAGDKLVAALAGMVRGFLDRKEAGRVLMSFWSRLPDDPRAAIKNAALYARWRANSALLVRHGQATGELTTACDVEAVAALMVGTVVGVVTQAYFDDGAIDPEAVVVEAARGLLAGLAERPDRGRPPRPRGRHQRLLRPRGARRDRRRRLAQGPRLLAAVRRRRRRPDLRRDLRRHRRGRR